MISDSYHVVKSIAHVVSYDSMPDLKMPKGPALKNYNLLITKFLRNGTLLDLLMKSGTNGIRLLGKSERFILKSLCQAYWHLLRVDKVAHRDIKPDNLMLSDDFHIAFIDFGHSEKVDSKDVSYCIVRGTPGYPAFEVT